jgi:hypothetical protein
MRSRVFLTIILLLYFFAASQILLAIMILTSYELQAVYVIPSGSLLGPLDQYVFHPLAPYFKALATLVLVSGTLGSVLATVICRKYFSSRAPSHIRR